MATNALPNLLPLLVPLHWPVVFRASILDPDLLDPIHLKWGVGLWSSYFSFVGGKILAKKCGS